MYATISGSFSLVAILAAVCPASSAPTSCTVNGRKYNVDTIISKDVAIIGGGSAGTYSAIRLGDLGKSVVVIEGTGRLGGHTQTYVDPTTGVAIDYGVQVFHNYTVVTDYFNRLDVSYSILDTAGVPGVTTEYIDFTTGKVDLAYIPGGSPAAFSQAFGAFSAQVFQYPYVDYGYSLPNPVPIDLYLSFGEFVKKYSLGAIVPFVWGFAQGVGDLLKVPTLYVFKVLGISDLESLQTGFLTTSQHDNSLIYLSAQKILGTSVLYNSTVVDVERDENDGVSVIVKSGGKLILIRSQKLIIAIQPTLDNLKPVDLTENERSLFGKFKFINYFTGLLKNTGIPSNTSLVSYSPSLPYNIPALPSIYKVGEPGSPGVPDLFNIYFVAEKPLSGAEIEALVISQVNNAQVAGKVPANPEFVASSSHKPFLLQVSSDDIKDGFYTHLLALQGQKRTWYISATFSAHDSSQIWRYAESLFPAILA